MQLTQLMLRRHRLVVLDVHAECNECRDTGVNFRPHVFSSFYPRHALEIPPSRSRHVSLILFFR